MFPFFLFSILVLLVKLNFFDPKCSEHNYLNFILISVVHELNKIGMRFQKCDQNLNSLRNFFAATLTPSAADLFKFVQKRLDFMTSLTFFDPISSRMVKGRDARVQCFFVSVPVPRDTKTSGERDLRHIESRDNGTVPGLTEIIVPKWRNFLSRGILGPGLSCRFLFRSQLSRGFKSRSRSLSRGFRIMRHSLCQ